MSDPGRLAPAPAPLAGPHPGRLQRFLLQLHFPAGLRVTAGPELGEGRGVGEKGRCFHPPVRIRPALPRPSPAAGRRTLQVSAGLGWGGSRDCLAEGSSRPPPRGVLPSARQPDPPTHMPTGPRSNGGWSVSPHPSLLPQGGHLPAAMALSPQVLGPWVPEELCTGEAQPMWGAQRVQRALRSQSPAGW